MERFSRRYAAEPGAVAAQVADELHLGFPLKGSLEVGSEPSMKGRI